MSWEMRERGGPYYTRSRRLNGRVVREYVGGGIRGQEAAAMDAEARQQREEERREWREEKAEIAQIEDAVKGFGAVCKIAIAHKLEVSGYYNHRGEWRRHRG